MPTRWSTIVALGITCLALPARSLIIDDFGVAQTSSGPLATGPPVNTSVSGDMFGGSRTMSVGGDFPAFAATASIDSGTLSFTQSAPGQRFVDLGWTTPLRDFDLTQGGAITAFELHLDGFSGTTTVRLIVASDDFPNRAQLGRTLTGTGTLRFNFSAFPSGSSVYFQNASIIALRIQSTDGGAVLSGGLVAVPEPGSAALLLVGLACFAVRRQQRR